MTDGRPAADGAGLAACRTRATARASAENTVSLSTNDGIHTSGGYTAAIAAAVAPARGPAARDAIDAINQMITAPTAACAICTRRGACSGGRVMPSVARK